MDRSVHFNRLVGNETSFNRREEEEFSFYLSTGESFGITADSSVAARTSAMRKLTDVIDEQFQLLHRSSVAFIRIVPEELLYKQPRVPTSSMPIYSVGERLLRSAATVEQTFGGLTTNLWDDPFEWTLPESLATTEAVKSYLEEVDRTRALGFATIRTDQELYKQIALPGGETAALASVLISAFGKARHQQGSAFYAFRMLSDVKLPEV